MPKIYAPVKAFTGVRAGVAFWDGVGVCDDANLLTWFGARGYTIDSGQEDSKPLSKMNKAELLAYAAENGVAVDSGGTKAALLAAIGAAQENEAEGPENDHDDSEND